ncbi:hypothetical protein LXL04_028792 [Taraxacum kok-saghyz]
MICPSSSQIALVLHMARSLGDLATGAAPGIKSILNSTCRVQVLLEDPPETHPGSHGPRIFLILHAGDYQEIISCLGNCAWEFYSQEKPFTPTTSLLFAPLTLMVSSYAPKGQSCIPNKWYQSVRCPLPLSKIKPEDMKEDEWLLLDRQTLGVVRLSLAKNVAYSIASIKTTPELLKALSDMYERPSAANKVFFIRQLLNLKMMEGRSATDHINEFNSILSVLTLIGIGFEDELQALLLLSSLTNSWSGTVTAVSNSARGATMTFEMIRNLILDEDVHRQNNRSTSSSLLSVENRRRGANRGGNWGRERMMSGRVEQKNRKSVVCRSCGKSGHVRSHCSKLMADEGLRGMNLAEDDDEYDYDSDEGLILMSHTDEKVGKMRRLKQVISKESVSDLKSEDGSSRPCVPGKQKRVSFEEIDSPPKVGELGSSCSGVYVSTFSSSVGGSQIHRSPIASIGRCSGSRSSSRPQKSGSSGKSEVSGSSRTNGDDGLVSDVATVRHHVVRRRTKKNSSERYSPLTSNTLTLIAEIVEQLLKVSVTALGSTVFLDSNTSSVELIPANVKSVELLSAALFISKLCISCVLNNTVRISNDSYPHTRIYSVWEPSAALSDQQSCFVSNHWHLPLDDSVVGSPGLVPGGYCKGPLFPTSGIRASGGARAYCLIPISGIIASEDGRVRIDKFDGSEFGFWRMQIEDVLYQKKLHEPLSKIKPEEMKEEEWRLLDRQALGVVRLSLAKNVAYNIASITSTHELLKALSDMYERPSAANKVFLIRQLVNVKMMEGRSATGHINEFNSILSRLTSVGISFEDEVQALMLLSSLPESWSGTVTAVSSSAGGEKMTFEMIRNLILSEDVRRQNNRESSGSLLSIEDRRRRNNRGGNLGRERMTTGQDRQNDRKVVVCWICGESGHVRSHCPKLMADQGLRGMNLAENNDDDDYDSDEGLLLMYDHHEVVGDEKLKMKMGVPGVASGLEAHTDEKVGKMRKLKQVNSKGSMSDLKTADGSSRPCISSKQNRVSFEEVGSPPKVGELGSSCSGVYDSTFSSSVGGSQIHRSPIASIGGCSGSRSSSRPQKSGSSGKSEVSGSSRTNGDDGLVAVIATVRHHLVRRHTNENSSERYSSSTSKKLTCENVSSPALRMNPMQWEKARIDRSSLQNDTVFRVKDEIDGSMGRLGVHGSRQKGEFDSPLVKTTTLQSILHTVASENLHLQLVDVKRLGLLGDSSDDNIGEAQSECALARSKKNLTRKSLHGMKQTCELCYSRFDNFMRREGFERQESDQVSYLKKQESSYIVLMLCVDDVLIAGSNTQMINELMRQLTREFSEMNQGAVELEKVLGMGNHASECAKVGSTDRLKRGKALTDVPRYIPRLDSSGRDEQVLRSAKRSLWTGANDAPSFLGEAIYALAPHSRPLGWAVHALEAIHAPKIIFQSYYSASSDRVVPYLSVTRLLGPQALYQDEIDGSMGRLGVQGSRQKGEFGSPLVKTTTLQSVLNTVASENIHLQRVDVKRLGLLGDSSDVNIGEAHSEGELTRSKKNKTRKSLHSMKQTCKEWHLRFDNFMRRKGFERQESDQVSYMKKKDSSYIILMLCVDDVLIDGSNTQMINELMRQLTRKFSEVNLGDVELEKVLGTVNHASECAKVFAIKRLKRDGSMGRLGVQGSRQKGEFGSPLVKTTTLQSVLNTVASENIHLQRVDVKRLGLLGDSSDVNIGEAHSEGELTRSKKNKTRKSLHSMKQTCKEWHLRFDNFMRRKGFERQESDQVSYMKKKDSSYIILMLCVDDVLIDGSNTQMINELMRQLTRKFSEVNLGDVELEKVLGTVNHASECAKVFAIKRLKRDSISAVIPGGSSSRETNVIEKCEAQLVDSLSKGLQVGDCWDMKTCEQTRYKLKHLKFYSQEKPFTPPAPLVYAPLALMVSFYAPKSILQSYYSASSDRLVHYLSAVTRCWVPLDLVLTFFYSFLSWGAQAFGSWSPDGHLGRLDLGTLHGEVPEFLFKVLNFAPGVVFFQEHRLEFLPCQGVGNRESHYLHVTILPGEGRIQEGANGEFNLAIRRVGTDGED